MYIHLNNCRETVIRGQAEINISPSMGLKQGINLDKDFVSGVTLNKSLVLSVSERLRVSSFPLTAMSSSTLKFMQKRYNMVAGAMQDK